MMSKDRNGISRVTNTGLYPALFAELARRGYSQADLEMIASRSMMRVLRAAEAYARAHAGDPPIETPVPDSAES